MLIPLLLVLSATPTCEFVAHGNGPAGTVPVHAEKVVTGLEVPWSLAFLPNGDWLVTERPGRLRRVHAGKLVGEPLAKVEIGDTSEGGLLGLAVDPAFEKTRHIFLYVTRSHGGKPENSVERWAVSPDLTRATKDRVLLSGIAGARFHDGGRLRIGPDGMLYVSIGDATHSENAQKRDVLNGKILRLTLDGKPAPGNPFPGSPVFLLGVRNSEGFDWLSRSTLVVADHGPSGEIHDWRGHDELDVAHAGDNLGWPLVHGCDAAKGVNIPALSWEDAVPPGGALVYRGNEIPQWTGSVLMGILGARHLHRVVLDPNDPHHVLRHEVYFEGDPPNGYGRLRDVVQGPDGALYVTTSNCDGRGTCPDDKDAILRIRPGK